MKSSAHSRRIPQVPRKRTFVRGKVGGVDLVLTVCGERNQPHQFRQFHLFAGFSSEGDFLGASLQCSSNPLCNARAMPGRQIAFPNPDSG
jgi:hypothetical protein